MYLEAGYGKNIKIPLYYVFNFDEGGWAIIAADDIAIPVLAYSLKGFINENTINSSVRLWLDDISEQIYQAVKTNLQPKSSDDEWQHAINGNFKVNNRSVAPLLKSMWNQTQIVGRTGYIFLMKIMVFAWAIHIKTSL